MAQPIDDPLASDKKLARHIKILATPGKTKPRLSALEHLRADLKDNEQEKRNLYNRHYRNIWEVYTGEFLEYTQMMLALKPKPSEACVNQLLDILEECMKYVPGPFQKTTTVEMLHTMTTLRHVLYSKNIKPLRQRGLKIVLMLCLEHPKADPIMDLLMYAFDFNPFLPKWNVVRLKYDHETTKELTAAGPLVPRAGGVSVTKEETIEFMGEFFDFIERQKDQFAHWFGITKKFMLSSLFPDLMRKQQQKPIHDETGFKQCPPELQEALFNRFEHWHKTRFNDIGRELWTKDGNPEVAFELYCHSVTLDPTWKSFQERIFTFFHKILIVEPIPLTSKTQQVEFQNLYFSKLVTCLAANSLVDDTVLVAHVMFEIIRVTCEKKIWDSLDRSIQCTLQASILDITCSTLALVPSEVRGEKAPDSVLCPLLIESTFHCWVYTQTDDSILPGQWALLQERLRSTWHRPKALELCFEKVLQVSYNLLTKHLYCFDYFEKNEERIQKAGKRGAALTPDGRKLNLKRFPEVPSQTPWNLESYVRIWNHLFDILRNADAATLTNTKSPAVSAEVFRCVKQVIYIFIIAEELADFDQNGVYHKFDMVAAFAPWLWRQAQLPAQFLNEKCQVFKALCRLFCRHTQYRYSPRLLSQFYSTIQQGLEEHPCTSVAYTIIDTTVPIFSLALPGANILVPYYLQAISQIFVDVNPPPARTAERALLCLASLVCYARHFESLDNVAVKGGSTFKFADLKHHLCSIIHFLLERCKGKTEIHISLSMLAIILLEELYSATPDLVFLSEKTNWICTHVAHGMPIPQSALKALETLSLFSDRLEAVDPNLTVTMISQVCNAIIHWVQEPAASETVCAQLETLLVLLLAAPVACYANPQIILLHVTEAASCGVHSSDPKVQEAALKLIHNFMNFLHNFPTNGYYDRITSSLLDETDRNDPLWANIGDSIFSFYDVQGSNEALVTVRESELLSWVMHAMIYPASGQTIHRRLAYYFGQYLRAVAPLMVEIWEKVEELKVCDAQTAQDIIGKFRRLFTYENPDGILLPNTTPLLTLETLQDIESFQRQLMQSLLFHFSGFKKTQGFTSSIETAGRITSRDPTGTFSWDCEVNFDGHPRWEPSPGIVEKLGGPPTLKKYSPHPSLSEDFHASFMAGAEQQSPPSPTQPLGQQQPSPQTLMGGDPFQPAPVQPAQDPNDPWAFSPDLGNLGLDLDDLNKLDQMLDNEMTMLNEERLGDAAPTDNPWSALGVSADTEDWQKSLDNDFNRLEDLAGVTDDIDQMFSNFGQPEGMNALSPRQGPPQSPLLHSSDSTVSLSETPNLPSVQSRGQEFIPPAVPQPEFSPFEDRFIRPDWVEEPDVELESGYLRPEETNPVRCPKLELTQPPASNVYNLETLLQYTTDSSYTYDDEHVEWGTQHFTRTHSDFQPQIEFILMRMEQQEAKCGNALDAYTKDIKFIQHIHPAQPLDPIVTSGPLTNIRFFLAALGWLSYDALDDFKLLNNLTTNFKHIKGLDSTNGRECVKIALLYVDYGQQSERAVLANTLESSAHSALYHEVVRALFPLVQRNLHTGYCGGLEKYSNDTVGEYVPYYANILLEMVAHECVRFPSGSEKATESRKRHIGNDIVHVVWSEHVADYAPSTIISQFGSIVVVIYPLPNGLFRITVARKSDVPNTIAPIVHNTVLRKELLPNLLRQTAFVANQLARTSSGTYEGPFKTRVDKAAIVFDKCCELRKFQEIVTRVLCPLPKNIPEAPMSSRTPRGQGAEVKRA